MAQHPRWSPDGHRIVFTAALPGELETVRVAGRVEVLAELEGLRLDTIDWIPWMGLGPGDVPLVGEDLSTTDLYTLDWDAP